MSDVKKRLLAGLVAVVMVFSITACSDDDAEPSEDDAPSVGS